MVMDDVNNGGRIHGRGLPRPICERKCYPSIYYVATKPDKLYLVS